VSHDRALLDAVGARTIAIEDGTLHSHLGGWADYVRARNERKAAEQAAAKAPSGNGGGHRRESQKAQPVVSKGKRRRMDSIENEIQSAEAALASLEDELADPSAWSTPERSAKSSKRHEQAKQRIERLYEELSTLEA
jgi:ATP-binding cassette subfamily F protein 3